MKIKHKKYARKGFTLVELLVVIAIIAGLAGMSYGPIMKQVRASARTAALNKGKNLYVALFSFAKEHDGVYPSDATAKSDEDGTSVEGCFTQLLNRGEVEDEEIFWVKENAVLGNLDNKQPDNDGSVDPGECAWGYVTGLTTSSRSNIPVLFDSAVSAGSFDTGVWEGKAMVVKLSGSVEAMDIDFTGKPLEDDGSSKQGAILEKRGSSDVDIFSESALPNNAEVLVPQ